jgi:uncharacterized membrane protein HdeD (DUF308 family)
VEFGSPAWDELTHLRHEPSGRRCNHSLVERQGDDSLPAGVCGSRIGRPLFRPSGAHVATVAATCPPLPHDGSSPLSSLEKLIRLGQACKPEVGHDRLAVGGLNDKQATMSLSRSRDVVAVRLIHPARVTNPHPDRLEPRGCMTTGTSVTTAELSAVNEAARFWWLKLVAAGCWLLFSVVVFRFDWTTVSSISTLLGVVMLAAAATEAIAIFTSEGWWRIAYALLAGSFVVIGIVAFVHPGNTFAALAGIMSFYFIFKGAITIAESLGLGGFQLRWVTLLIGVAELLLGFWSAGYFGHRAVLLVAWIGALALTRAVTDVFEAFAIRDLRQA